MTLGQFARSYLATVYAVEGYELIAPTIDEPTIFPCYQVDLGQWLKKPVSIGINSVYELSILYTVRAWVAVATDSGLLDDTIDVAEEKFRLACDGNRAGGRLAEDGSGYTAEIEALSLYEALRRIDDKNGRASLTMNGILTLNYIVE